MLAYVVGLVAFVLFFLNPITHYLFPSSRPQTSTTRRTPRPQLNEDLLAIESPNDTVIDCARDGYSVHIFSKEPLVLYIENFLSDVERSHLLEISDPLFEPSTTTNDGGATTQSDPSVRLSSVALIPRTDLVRCVEKRARALQGWRPEIWVERLRTQLYVAPRGHYTHHFDWSSNAGGWGRVSSMMAWVAGDADAASSDGREEEKGDFVEGGGTEFPLLRLKGEPGRWCRYIECGEDGKPRRGKGAREQAEDDSHGDGGEGEVGVGITFKPKPGNAVYWENFRADGSARGYQETWHAGLPVTKGRKVGLNIWSWGRIE